MKNEKRKRLSIEIPEEWHTKIKARTALQKMSIQEWVLQSLIETILKEDAQIDAQIETDTSKSDSYITKF